MQITALYGFCLTQFINRLKISSTSLKSKIQSKTTIRPIVRHIICGKNFNHFSEDDYSGVC